MKKVILGLCMIVMLQVSAYATWQVANPFHKNGYPLKYAVHHSYIADVYKGTLADNTVRIASKYGWTVVWHCYPKDPVLLNTKIAGISFPNMLNKLLDHYDVHTRYFSKEKVLVFDRCGKKKYFK